MSKFPAIILGLCTAGSLAYAAGPTTRPASTTRPAPLATTQPATRPALATTGPATRPAKAVAVPVAARPAIAVGVNRFGINVKAQRDQHRTMVQNFRDVGTRKLEQLIRFTLADGRLRAQWIGDAFSTQYRFKVAGSNAIWVVNSGNPVISIARYDFDAPEDNYWMIQFTAQAFNDTTTIYALGGAENEVYQLIYTQQGSQVALTLMPKNNPMGRLLNAASSDLYQLRGDNPDHVRRHLIPVMRKITGLPILRPGPGDVYRVFADIPADPTTSAKVRRLLPAMASIEPDEREAASKSLRDLGAAGVLAAMRCDARTLLPEQFNRLSNVVALSTRMAMDEPADLAKDVYFMIECFEDDDASVRVAAKAAVERMLGAKVDFDPNAPAPKRAAAADALRVKLNKDAQEKRAAEEKAEQAAPVAPAGQPNQPFHVGQQ